MKIPLRAPLTVLRDAHAFVPGALQRIAALSGFSAVGSAAEACALLLVTRSVVDAVQGRRTPGAGWLVLVGGLLLIRLVTVVSASKVGAGLAGHALRTTRRRVLGSFMGTSWSEQSKFRLGTLQETLTTNVDRVAGIFLSLSSLIVAAVSLATLVVIALVIDPLATSFFLGGGLLIAAAIRPLGRAVRRTSARHVEANRRFAEAVTEAAALTREARIFGVGAELLDRLAPWLDESTETYARSRFLANVVPGSFQTAALGLVAAGVAVLGASGSQSVVTIGSAVLILLRSLTYVQQVLSVGQQLNESVPHLRRIELLRRSLEAQRPHHGSERLGRVNHIRFDDVWFSYEDGHPVLKGLSFEVPGGECIGVVGPSGAGKSTLVNVLLRLHEVQRGRVLVNGRPIGEFSDESFARQVAYVPQEPRLLSGSVAENVAFLRHMGEVDVSDALGAAAMRRDLGSWPEGVDRSVGEHGSEVSGGQRQRIALARALAGRPSLLVLDEPTSALDPISEAAIHDAIGRIKGTATVVLIAHRKSILALCDRVLVLPAGRVADLGPVDAIDVGEETLAELLRSSGLT